MIFYSEYKLSSIVYKDINGITFYRWLDLYFSARNALQKRKLCLKFLRGTSYYIQLFKIILRFLTYMIFFKVSAFVIRFLG